MASWSGRRGGAGVERDSAVVNGRNPQRATRSSSLGTSTLRRYPVGYSLVVKPPNPYAPHCRHLWYLDVEAQVSSVTPQWLSRSIIMRHVIYRYLDAEAQVSSFDQFGADSDYPCVTVV